MIENKRKKNKILVWSQVLSLIIEIFAISFILGGMSIGVMEKVQALDGGSSPIPVSNGCCLEAKDGSFCQLINRVDESSCKNPLIATSCNQVEECQVGCCYDAEAGSCSLNSPKQRCLDNGGNWSKTATCEIAACQLGCCVLGDQASIVTSRECSKLSADYKFEKNFQNLDADGTCKSKVGLSEQGACVTPSKDFSNENDCKFTTKGNCKSGSFYQGYLCTAPDLKTSCKPSKQTTCLTNKDQIYYLDSCGNTANVYDSSKFDDISYWTNIISVGNSCKNGGKDCGNCDYMSGSRCGDYRTGKDTKATFGDKVCQNLNCVNGRKHGESWCIEDYNSAKIGTSPVGSRGFVGKCLDGEITIEPCADFNQQICMQSTSESVTEAQCIMNDWRACITANDKGNYDATKIECEKSPQCIMFDKIPGNEKYSDLAGFKTGVDLSEQGAAGKVGIDTNKVITWCVPKYTPGMVFWNTDDKTKKFVLPGTGDSTTTNQQPQSYTGLDYGGSLTETAAICSLGSFTCVSHKEKKPANTGSWKDKENPECNIDAESEESRAKVPLLMEALNERCRSLGPCGVYVNVAGESATSENSNSSIMRLKINAKGKKEILKSSGYDLSEEYLASLAEKPELIEAGSLTKLTAAVIAVITGKVTETNSQTTQEAQGEIASANSDSNSIQSTVSGVGGSLGMIGVSQGVGVGMVSTTTTFISGGTYAYNTPAAGTYSGALGAASWAAVGMIVGYYLGKLIAKNSGMTPGQSTAFTGAMMGLGGAIGAGGYAIYASYVAGSCVTPPVLGCVVGLVLLIILIIYAVYSYFFTGEDHEYYVTKYTCEPWSAPASGDCNLCNNDIRTCSEYRCRSLGTNCHYYNENGEPGYCASLAATWSAHIKPWPEALTTGNKYAAATDKSFKIQAQTLNGEVAAWENLQFGIITDDRASCRLDTVHTSSFEEMKYNFAIDNQLGCSAENCINQGTNHKIVLSPFVGINSTSSSMPPLAKGENNYYIRCRNFAGAVNEGEFAVKITRGDEPDVTSPLITRFNPDISKWVKQGENSTSIMFFVNEPSECKYSQNLDNRYEDMTGNVSCFTDPDFGIMGEWACFTSANNLISGENKFYFECKDQPDIDLRFENKRNINRNSKQYSVKVCSNGLNITKLEPKNIPLVGQAPINLTITAQTKGCVDGGVAKCTYSFQNNNLNSNYSAREIEFLNTGSINHNQKFDSMPAGISNITVKCTDEAGNVAIDSLIVNVTIDNIAPKIVRAYDLNNQLTVTTDENSKCKYTTDKIIGCDFGFDLNNASVITMNGEGKLHSSPWIDSQEYYIKCQDVFGNTNSLCGISVKAS